MYQIKILITVILIGSFAFTTKAKAGQFKFLGISKPMAKDPIRQQEMANKAVDSVADAVAIQPGFDIEVFNEKVMTRSEYRANSSLANVNRDKFIQKFKSYASSLAPSDTIIVYNHTHGAGPEAPYPGIIMEPRKMDNHGGTIGWDEYANLLLSLPAKNVIVLTMACYSGGLVSYLNRPGIKSRWGSRSSEGRNFVVLTAQDDKTPSVPAMINGKMENPFTYSIHEMLKGEADKNGDKITTLGEMIDFVLSTTKKVSSTSSPMPAHPMYTGSFDSHYILLDKQKIK